MRERDQMHPMSLGNEHFSAIASFTSALLQRSPDRDEGKGRSALFSRPIFRTHSENHGKNKGLFTTFFSCSPWRNVKLWVLPLFRLAGGDVEDGRRKWKESLFNDLRQPDERHRQEILRPQLTFSLLCPSCLLVLYLSFSFQSH